MAKISMQTSAFITPSQSSHTIRSETDAVQCFMLYLAREGDDYDTGTPQKLNFTVQNCYKIVSYNNICQFKSVETHNFYGQ